MPTATRISKPLRVDRMDNGDRRLVRDLVIDLGVDLGLGADAHPGFTLSEDGSTTIVTVPKGFETDFSSIPWFARFLYRFDSVDLAGCCHDLAYRVGVPRDVSDDIWWITARSGTRHVGSIRGRIGWLCLRAFGGPAYNPTGDPMVRHTDVDHSGPT